MLANHSSHAQLTYRWPSGCLCPFHRPNMHQKYSKFNSSNTTSSNIILLFSIVGYHPHMHIYHFYNHWLITYRHISKIIHTHAVMPFLPSQSQPHPPSPCLSRLPSSLLHFLCPSPFSFPPFSSL